MSPALIRPDWPSPPNIRAFVTTRKGGVSTGVYQSFNLGMNAGDSIDAVQENRNMLRSLLPAPVKWLKQVHGTTVTRHDGNAGNQPAADAIISSGPGQVCAVLTADCLPVLFADTAG
jgi:copper oxidase (laccase) domain-containing protein